MSNSNKFEFKLSKYVIKHIKTSFDPLKDYWYKGENAKKRAIFTIIQNHTSSGKKMFTKWIDTVKSHKHIKKSR